MMDRGARRFVFLQRSGTDRPEAKELVDSMVLKGMTVDVVRGDVSVASDVAKVRAAAAGPIKGVVQAAMVLRVCERTRNFDVSGIAYNVFIRTASSKT